MARRSAAEMKEEETPPLHPKLAEQLVAHGDSERQLLAMIQAGRLPHAILMTGPRGIGKATLAWRLARFLLAPQETGGGLFGDPLPPESLHVSSSNPAVRRIVAGTHPDMLALEAEDIKIDEARQVPAFLALTPAESERRVVIIDSVDAMNRNAANALLKTLEEPPARATLLLISHNPGALLPTIRSRCRQLRMPPLEQAEFARVMGLVAPDLTPQQAQIFAVLSGGSPGVALALIQGRADKLYQEMVERISMRDTLKDHAFAERLGRKGNEEAFATFARLFMWLLTRITAPETVTELFAGEHAALARLRGNRPLDAWLDLWEKVGRLLADTRNLHLDKKQALITILRAASE